MVFLREEYYFIIYFLERGEDVNVRNVRGDIVFFIFFQYVEFICVMEIVKFFFKYGVDINIKNGRFEMFFQIVCFVNLDKVVEFFLEYGCEVNVYGVNLNFFLFYYVVECNNS